ncbi:MAG: HEAT repeat domain-containing protein, partial [Verrucomicrobia bacterium]|nr:HEAT repeat domain-containing protein [Verrucomicrobiota bacterium]
MAVKVKTQWWIIAGTFLGVVAVGVVTSLPPKEPVYQGRRLSSWIQAFRDGDDNHVAPAIHAVHALGSNAVPTLLRSLRVNDSVWKRTCAATIAKLPAEWKSALPEVELSAWRVRARCASCLGDLGVLAAPAVPELIRALTDPAQAVRFSAAEAVGKIGVEPQLIVPVLTSVLHRDPDLEVRLQAVQALGRIGPRAQPALPVLLGILKSTNNPAWRDPVERCVSEAIWRIDPTQTAGLVPVLLAQLRKNNE